jgi:hypothetical protein
MWAMLDGPENGSVHHPLKKQWGTLDKRPPIWYNTLMSDEPKTVRIILEIEERTYRSIRNEIFTKNLCGNAWGLLDGFIAKMCKKIDAGEDFFYVEKKSQD